MKRIVLGGGCFWCTEAIYKREPSVTKVLPGYAGGNTENPSYEEVCSAETGHAEVIQVEYDEAKVKLEELLDLFFRAHDPTTLNKQGNDHGTQYRSIILYENEKDKKVIEEAIKKAQKNHKDKIVTEVKKLEKFYQAEEKHLDYYKNNKLNPYCMLVIKPKLNKTKEIKK